MGRSKRGRIAVALLAGILFLSGCDVQIFEKKIDPYQMVAYKKEALEVDTYYVKDGTSFYPLYKKGGTASSVVTEASDTRLLWFLKDRTLVPTYYQNETIAIPSMSTSITEINIERYKDCGCSIGVYGANFAEDGLKISLNEGGVEGSSFYDAVSAYGTDDIKIVSINGVPVTENTVNRSGIITGLQQDAVYKIGFYAGSKYEEADIIADVWFLKSFEVFEIPSAESTQNGYLAIQFDKDFKSGYYLVNGYGICRYYDKNKAEITGNENMNEPYYKSEVEQMAVFSQQFVKEVPYTVKDVVFTVTYQLDSLSEDHEPAAYLTNPSGERIPFSEGKDDQAKGEGSLSIALNEASPGKWLINIYPKDLVITNVLMTSSNEGSENKQETYEVHLDDAKTNMIFYVEFEGTGDISAIMVDSDGNTNSFIRNDEKSRMEYNASYAGAGEYTIYVYHQLDTKIVDVNMEEDQAQYETDVITVEE